MKYFRSSHSYNKLFVRIALLLAVIFVLLQTSAYIAPYEYFPSNDSYRDYDTVNEYLLNSVAVPNTLSYHDRPNLYYFLSIITLTSNINLFDLIRFVAPMLFSLSVLTFYLFYKEAFKKEYLAISGALITVMGNQFFNEVTSTRPNILGLIIFPIAGYLFIRLWKDKYNISIMLALCVSILSMHFAHFFGSVILACVVMGLMWLYRKDMWKYYFWLIPIIGIGIAVVIFDPNNLLISTLRHAYTIIITRDPTVFINEALSLSTIIFTMGFWPFIISVSGLTIVIMDTLRHRNNIDTMPILWLGISLGGIMLFFSWIGSYIGLGILPIRMLVYLWLAVIIFFLYYLHRMHSWALQFVIICISLLVFTVTRLPNDAIDNAYILGSEIEVIDFMSEKNIENSLIITQVTNSGIFTFDENNNTIMTNWTDEQNKQFKKIFFSGSSKKAGSTIAEIKNELPYKDKKDVYVVFSTIKNTNTYLWPNDWFQVQSLSGADLSVFYDPDYFSLVFDNGEIKMWKWTRKSN